ncbi:hypothetical protein BJ138DRAFT_1105918 [Hygrophoropsis aurantiaca]|uniref:Uncharacterized protein n=1 Tax=Hygrophoropsis aurantiaca TaxID=72124 RepID=A0ACB7ZXA8_9AGAM|nr:hypothetical protein BJ138DRAFT_1105918 [Hygrophoropsis aurantiaca]
MGERSIAESIVIGGDIFMQAAAGVQWVKVLSITYPGGVRGEVLINHQIIARDESSATDSSNTGTTDAARQRVPTPLIPCGGPDTALRDAESGEACKGDDGWRAKVSAIRVDKG